MGTTWAEYVNRVGQMTKQEFVEILNQYRQGRAIGDREHLRETDKLTGAISPMKVYGVPVGKMFLKAHPECSPQDLVFCLVIPHSIHAS